MIRRPPRSTLSSSSAASDVYKRQVSTQSTGRTSKTMSSTLEAAESAMATAILSGTAQDRDRAVKRLAMAANQNGVEISRSYTTQLREAIEAANAGNDPELQEAIKASLVGVRVPEESGHVPLSMEDVEPGMAVMVTSDTAVYEASFTGVEDIIPQVLNQYTEPAHRSRQRLGEQGVVVKLDTKRRTVKVKLDSDEAEVWFTPGSLYIASAREISVRSQDQGLPGQPSSEEWWVYLRNDQFGEWNIRCDPTPDATVVGGIAQVRFGWGETGVVCVEDARVCWHGVRVEGSWWEALQWIKDGCECALTKGCSPDGPWSNQTKSRI
eukprot:TRINITY_DN5151_c0_g2_i3.p1 TRINITY_DN5151_c0_g2~~TRINITY_DN5151_c0_g2_i3.p1  ORF type:complete len:324 (+),score=75.60 TRINITY_DN5151_c0_g2_i3:99-1070(+)